MRSLRCTVAFAALLASAAPCIAQSSAFGNAVVIGDAELIIAEPNNHFRPGTVYVYSKNGGGWQETAQLRAPDAERADGFGTVLAATGNTLFVGQRGGRIHVFERDHAGWTDAGSLAIPGVTGPDPGCGDQYGYCDRDFGISFAADGDWLLVGERGQAARVGRGGRGRGRTQPARPGYVYAFQRTADGDWTQRARLEPADAQPGDLFGTAIALAGRRALIGAPNRTGDGEPAIEGAGRVFEFRLEGGEWHEAGALGSGRVPDAGFGAAIAIQGDTALVGVPGGDDGHGAVVVYGRDPERGAWSEENRLAAPDSVSGDRFGSALAVDGADVWVGAPMPRGLETGAVYVFSGRMAGAALEDEPRTIRLTETVERDGFGDRIVARAGVAAVTATGMHHQAGAVYVYERAAHGEWRDADRLVSAPDALEPMLGQQRRCTDGSVGPFDCADVELLAFLPNSMLRAPEHARGVRTNDNWGWTDPQTGREYALVGRNDGTSFVDITDPVNPVLVGDLPKTPDTPPSQLWRDIKVYENYAFIVADGAGDHGMQIFDLRRLRDAPDEPALFESDAHYTRVASVHNIAINEETGFAYLVGSRGGGDTCGGGLHMVDVREPLSPRFVGCFRDQRGTHDVQCAIYRGPDERYHGREVCLMSNADAFAIADVTEKADPTLISRASHPNPAYLHQGWLTSDHRYFFMDDESDVIQGNVETTRTLVWDLSDLQDPVLAREFMGSMPASAHNLYVKDNLVYQANYRYGLHILDIADPLNPREVGRFDTSPYLEGPGFSGAWSNYPFFDSGTVIVTSLQEGLFVLKRREPEVLF